MLSPITAAWLLAAATLPLLARTAEHHLFVGTYGTPAIYSVTYDDIAQSLRLVRNNTTRTENEWLALSYDGNTLYSSGTSGWSSFPVTNPTTIGGESNTTPPIGTCANYGGVFILASKRAPYSVYGSLSCANYIEVGPDGDVGKATEVPYNDAVIIYGMAMDPSYSYLYSTDWKNGKIWTHKVNDDGSLTPLGSVDAPSAVSAPRSVVVHPSGNTLYITLEAWNTVALYTINKETHLPEYANALYPTIASSANAGNYGAQAVTISAKGSQLWATARSRVQGESGYLTGWSLSETGIVQEMIFQVETTAGTGRSNYISASPFAENTFALVESGINKDGTVSIWKYDGTAKKVASVSVPSEVSTSVWLD